MEIMLSLQVIPVLTQVFWLVYLVLMLALYVYTGMCFMKIANKTHTPNSWFAWVPILNFVLFLQIVKRPVWWIVFFFIPFVNFIAIIVIGILIWMDLCKLFGKPSWLGVLSVLTPVGLVLEGYLAFSSVLPVENVVSTPAPVPTPMPPSTPMPAQNPMM
jgi:hypothetical protein